MIIRLPRDVLEYLYFYLYESDCWSVSKSSKHFYTLMKDKLIDDWITKGCCKITRSNIDKLSIKNENILVDEYIFYCHIPGVYISKHVRDEHNHLFISIDKFMNSSSRYNNFENAIVEDENGNIIRGVVDYETIM